MPDSKQPDFYSYEDLAALWNGGPQSLIPSIREARRAFARHNGTSALSTMAEARAAYMRGWHQAMGLGANDLSTGALAGTPESLEFINRRSLEAAEVSMNTYLARFARRPGKVRTGNTHYPEPNTVYFQRRTSPRRGSVYLHELEELLDPDEWSTSLEDPAMGEMVYAPVGPTLKGLGWFLLKGREDQGGELGRVMAVKRAEGRPIEVLVCCTEGISHGTLSSATSSDAQ